MSSSVVDGQTVELAAVSAVNRMPCCRRPSVDNAPVHSPTKLEHHPRFRNGLMSASLPRRDRHRAKLRVWERRRGTQAWQLPVHARERQWHNQPGLDGLHRCSLNLPGGN